MVLGLGSWEIVFIGLALLVLFGPEHAPELLRSAGRMQARFRDAFRELEDAVEREREEATEPFRLEDEDLPSSEESED